MTPKMLYWLLKLDDIRAFFDDVATPFLFIGILAVIAFLAAHIFLVCMDQYTEKDEIAAAHKTAKITGWVGIPCLFIVMLLYGILALTPTTKQMAIIYVAPKIINNEQAQKIPQKLLDLTDDWIDELKPENIKKEAVEE